MRPLFQRLLLSAAAIFALAVPACSDSSDSEGFAWRADPSEEAMPRAFDPGDRGYDALPDYAKAWRMPPGFASKRGVPNFAERWNKRVRDWLDDSLRQENEQLRALADRARNAATPAEKQHAADALTSCRKRIALFERRAREPEYLRFLERSDLPPDLVWQSNWNEPELGDPRARKGGVMRLAFARSYPGTFRCMGPESNNGFRGYLRDDIEMELVRTHPGTGRVIPGLADRWALSSDGRTVYYHIDAKATFSDGAPVTTQDFIAAMYLRTSPEVASSYYVSSYLNDFAHITLYGDRILAVTFPSTRPLPLLYGCLPCDPAHFYAEFGPDFASRYQWRLPPSTGGYAGDPEGVLLGRNIHMKRVADWWAKDRRYTRYSCNADYIDYAFYADPAKIRELFRIGELDAASVREPEYWYEGLEIDEVHRGYIHRIQFANIWPRPPFGFFLNCSRPPFDNIDVRLGFQHAMNIDRVIETVFRGDAVRLHSYATGFGPYTNESIRARAYSPALARACFARAGYTETDAEGYVCTPEGKRLVVDVSCMTDPLYANFMNQLRAGAAKCGLEIRTDSLDNTVFYLKTMDKKVQAAVWSWAFMPPLPSLRQGFHSSFARDDQNRPVPGTNNITATADAQMDKWLDDESFAATEEEAKTASHRIQQRIHDLAVWTPGWTMNFRRLACWRWVRWPDCPGNRFCPPRYFDPLDSHLYWIDEEERRRTLDARARGESYPEREYIVPLPEEPAPHPES